MTAKRITHFINGESWNGNASRTGDVYNPATGEVTGKVDFADNEVVDQAVTAASAAAKEWRKASLAKRAQVLFAFREIATLAKKNLQEQLPQSTEKYFPTL